LGAVTLDSVQAVEGVSILIQDWRRQAAVCVSRGHDAFLSSS